MWWFIAWIAINVVLIVFMIGAFRNAFGDEPGIDKRKPNNRETKQHEDDEKAKGRP